MSAWTSAELESLKERLLQEKLAGLGDEASARLFRLVAGEAEALAWQTEFPALCLPLLLEEKLDAARRYLSHQAELRSAL